MALRKTALIQAQALFAAGTAQKVYWAVVTGHPANLTGRIENRLARRSRPGGWCMVADPVGQPAVTDWQVRGSNGTVTWLELRPHTGRTHQVRIHCAALGCPILGDPVYGGPSPHRLHLLARALALPLADPVAAQAPPPDHMHDALARCGWD